MDADNIRPAVVKRLKKSEIHPESTIGLRVREVDALERIAMALEDLAAR